MILDYIIIGIIVASVVVIIVLLVRKFPMLAAIDTAKLPRHRQGKVKQGLIEDRLKRKLSIFNLKKVLSKTNEEGGTVSFIKRFRTIVKDLEQKYRQKIEQLEPGEQVGAERKKVIMLEEAKKLASEENYKSAESKYIEVISLDPRYSEAYEGLAEVYTLMKDYAHAKETYQFIIKLNAADDAAYEQLGRLALREGRLDEAEADYLKSLSLNNQVASYHVDLGEVYVAMADFRKALHSFEEAIKLEPNNPRYLNCAVEAALKLKDAATAKKYLDKLRSVNPENEKLEELEAAIDSLKSV